MPMASMSAPSRSDWDRNAYHVRKGVVLMFRIHLQITSRALSSGGDAAYLPARPHRKKKRQPAAALVEAARSLALETGVAWVTLTAVANRAGVHYSAVRRHFPETRVGQLLVAPAVRAHDCEASATLGCVYPRCARRLLYLCQAC